MSSYPPPIPNEVFNPADFVSPGESITIDTLKGIFLTYPIGQGHETLPSLTVQGNSELGSTQIGGTLSAAGTANFTGTTNTLALNVDGTLTIQHTNYNQGILFTNTSDQQVGSIKGSSFLMDYSSYQYQQFNVNSNMKLRLGYNSESTLQDTDVIISGSTSATINGGNIALTCGAGENLLSTGNEFNIENATINLGTSVTSEINVGNVATPIELSGTTINSTATTSIDLQAPYLNCQVDTGVTFTTPNVDITSVNSAGTYFQLIPTFVSGITDTATLWFGSATQIANSYISLDGLTSMAMTISSAGSVILSSAQDMVQLSTAPSGNVDAAVATVGYVNAGYIPVGGGFPSGFIGQSVRVGVNALPSGWVYCDGAEYPTNGIYANLFAVIGTTYGVPPLGKFYVPNIATQFLIASDNAGSGNAPSSNISNENAQTGGANTLNSYQLPAHSHTFGPIFNGSAGGGSYGQYVPSGKTPDGPVYYPDTSSAGSNATFSPPYFACHFMIKL